MKVLAQPRTPGNNPDKTYCEMARGSDLARETDNNLDLLKRKETGGQSKQQALYEA